ncbi:hypothetical protein DFH09DRAFT_114039 [Mycena vulgaris]|nr:hypothetical protein DFH09DRAFT_114039 [Mycena vulgaris]
MGLYLASRSCSSLRRWASRQRRDCFHSSPWWRLARSVCGVWVYEGLPARIAVINWRTFNRTMGGAGPRRRAWCWISPRRGATVTLKRLTAPGNDERDSDFVTWAKQAWTNGTAEGKAVREAVKDGKIQLRGSEAVVVFLR